MMEYFLAILIIIAGLSLFYHQQLMTEPYYA